MSSRKIISPGDGNDSDNSKVAVAGTSSAVAGTSSAVGKSIKKPKLPKSKSVSQKTVKKVAGHVHRFLPGLMSNKKPNNSPFSESPLQAINLSSMHLERPPVDFFRAPNPSPRPHLRVLPSNRNGKIIADKRIENPHAKKKKTVVSNDFSDARNHNCHDPSCPECDFDYGTPETQPDVMPSLSAKRTPSNAPTPRNPRTSEIDSYLNDLEDDIEEIDTPMIGLKKAPKACAEVQIVKVVKSTKRIERESEVEFLRVVPPKKCDTKPPAKPTARVTKRKIASNSDGVNRHLPSSTFKSPPVASVEFCHKTPPTDPLSGESSTNTFNLKSTTEDVIKSQHNTNNEQSRILESIKEANNNKDCEIDDDSHSPSPNSPLTNKEKDAKLTEPMSKEDCMSKVVDRASRACKNFKLKTGIDLRETAWKTFRVHAWDFNAINWWAHNGRCIPAPNQLWNTPHLLHCKQAHILELILCHPILDRKCASKFCEVFEQGDFHCWTCCFECHFTFPRGERWWPNKKPSTDSSVTDGDALDDGDIDTDSDDSGGWPPKTRKKPDVDSWLT